MGDWLNALRRLEEERSPPQQQALVPILIPQPNPAAMVTNPTRRHAVAIQLEDLRHDLNLIAQLIVCHTARGDSLAKEIEVAEAIVAELKDKHQQSVAESNRLDQVGTLNIMKQRLLHQELCVDFKQYQVLMEHGLYDIVRISDKPYTPLPSLPKETIGLWKDGPSGGILKALTGEVQCKHLSQGPHVHFADLPVGHQRE